jgi:putative SOS response-associated peptidase YedK
MCGRFTLIADRRTVARLFDLAEAPELFPRYNVAPTQSILAVRQGAEKREAVTLRWGLISSWSKDGKAPLINARHRGEWRRAGRSRPHARPRQSRRLRPLALPRRHAGGPAPPLLRPAPDDALTALAVGPFVNSARHEGPSCVERLGGSSLFDRPPG